MKKPTGAKAPATLSGPARDLWRKYVAQFAIDDVHGLFLLEQALLAFDRLNEAAAAVARDGAVKLDRFGMPRAHPSLVVERDARAAMLAALKALHLDLAPVKPIGRPPGS